MQRQANRWFGKKEKTTTPTRYTVSLAADAYIRHLEIEKGTDSAKDARFRVKALITPALGTKLLEDLRPHHIRTWLHDLIPQKGDAETIRKAKDTANRHLTTFKALLNLAWRDEKVGSDTAWRKVTGFKSVGASRKVFLNDKQIKRLYDKTEGAFHDLVKALLMTGMRPGKELRHLLVEQLDKQLGTLDIRVSKTGPRTVYLSDEGLAFFKKLAKGKTPKAYLLGRDDGSRWPEKYPERIMTEVVKKAKLLQGTVLYSLRHTYISKAIVAGIPLQVISENCGTSIRMIEEHYGKFLQQYRREQFNKLKMA